MLLGLIGQHGEEEGPPLMQAVVSRMTDATISRFVSRHVIAGDTSTDRLAQAFQTLVRDGGEQQRLLALAKDDVAASPLGSTEGFESVWNNVAEKLLTSYSDEPFVSDAYGKELSGARTKAIEVEGVSDDPPERIGAWLGTIATTALRALDLTLMLDLLRIEQDEERWRELMKPLVGLIEDLLLVGDFDAAAELIAVLVAEAPARDRIDRAAADRADRDRRADRRVDDAPRDHPPGDDRRGAVRARQGDVRVARRGAGAAARRSAVGGGAAAHARAAHRDPAGVRLGRPPHHRAAEELAEPGGAPHRDSPDAAVRRQRGAARSDRAARRQRAAGAARSGPRDSQHRHRRRLPDPRAGAASGTPQSREAIMQSISLVRDERATPLFAYILGHVDHRGALAPVYLRAIESLGALRDPDGIAPLRDALYKGEWWAPRRTGALRAAAAAALARIGTPGRARRARRGGRRSGSRGVRSAARAQLANARPRRPARAPEGGDA